MTPGDPPEEPHAPVPVYGRRGRVVTIEDVAALAGVSVATVSRALRGLANVAPATRARVEEAAGELRYRADPNASRLAAGHTRSIGIAMPIIGSWYFSQVLAGVEGVLAPAGYDLLVYSAAGPEDRRRFLGDALPVRKRVDGLVLVDFHLPPTEVGPWAESGVCLVTVGQATERFPSVTIDDQTAARTAVAHLVELGHREIAVIAGEDERFHFNVPRARRRGFDEALAEVGCTVRPEHVADGAFTVESGRAAMDRLLAERLRPTAVFAASDEMAFGSMQSAREHGLRVPEDLSVVGFDDHDLAEATGLTTIRQPVVSIGAVAARLLLEELAAGVPGGAAEVVPTELVVRSSTGPPPP